MERVRGLESVRGLGRGPGLGLVSAAVSGQVSEQISGLVELAAGCLHEVGEAGWVGALACRVV